MPRSVQEWVGKTDDERPPPRVRTRVLERYKHRCHWSKRPIGPGDDWDLDHLIALCNGGENREKNLAPILRGTPHREKTDADLAIKQKITRMQQKHNGTYPKSRARIQSRGFQKTRPT